MMSSVPDFIKESGVLEKYDIIADITRHPNFSTK